MLERRCNQAWWVALCASVIACTAGSSTQVVTGHLAARDAVAVRAVDHDEVAATTRVRADGTFRLALPVGGQYRLEVLTARGVARMLAPAGQALDGLTFEVCKPTSPWDVGEVGVPSANPGKGDGTDAGKDDGNGDGKGGGDGKGTGGGNDKPCDPGSDPLCKCDPGTGVCSSPCSDPSDPGCGGGDPGPGCTPESDPNCGCPPDQPSCKTCDDPTGKACEPSPPPSCDDPANPNACPDPCMKDPTLCGCEAADPGCWKTPDDPTCDAGGTCSDKPGLTPQYPPIDFGCGLD